MFEYRWGNPTTIMFSSGRTTQVSDRSHQILDHYNQAFNESPPVDWSKLGRSHNLHQHHQTQTQTHLHPLNLYVPQAYGDPFLASSASQPAIAVVPKSEPGSGGVDFTARIGLNLGRRTYFSSWSDGLENRPSRRFRHFEFGSAKSPRCQAEGCNADLARSKNYHRRHKVCEFHSKATTVAAAGIIQRFCQQCSRFHLLSEFDDEKRSCRKRLALHNRRRRKSQKLIQEGKSLLQNAANS